MFSEFVKECARLLEDHRKVYHVKVKQDCVVCRSLRRSIVRGI